MRIIPTRVGTSGRFAQPLFEAKDHPHACGDKPQPRCLQVRFGGSSPRVWGQVGMSTDPEPRAGIIPTRVGTSLRTFPACYYANNHPHACGDKLISTVVSSGEVGSSPRVWGQAIIKHIFLLLIRIIPTRVGTSFELETGDCTA